jgi:glycosyltransferase involved in cell wall biosynthesis|tara:strand:+ start:15610 stop:16743 length:1134 start_codon:yes stop_codon:yes gene_type:complete
VRILYVIKKLEYGGAEFQLLAIADRQRNLGHAIKIITLNMPEPYFLDKVKQADLDFQCVDFDESYQLPVALIRLRKAIVQYHPDIVHSHMYHSNILTRLIYITWRRALFVSTAHNIREGSRFRDWMYRITDKFCDVTTNVSRAAVDRYNVDGLVRNHACELVENGIDTNAFRRDQTARRVYRKKMNSTDNFIWLYVGSLTTQKDLPNLLQAFSQIAEHRAKPKLYIVGDGPEQRSVSSRVTSLGLDDRVTLLGNRNDLMEWYSMADGFVLGSAWEGLPIVLLEALSCSLPAVVTNVGGNSDLVVEGSNGYLAPPQNPTLLADKMAELMNLPECDRQYFGEYARSHIVQNFDLDIIATRWRELYQRPFRNSPFRKLIP